MTARKRRQRGRDVPAEIDRHDFRIKAIVHDFAINPRFRREIEGALRRGPLAVSDLLDEIAREQDLRDVAAMLEGVADCTPETQRIVLRDAIALIERVQKALDGDLLQRRGT